MYYGKQGRLEYDFVVAPGADPNKIKFQMEGALRVQSGTHGELLVETGLGDIDFDAPAIYQTASDGSRHAINGRYSIGSQQEVGFEIASYDHSKPLIIDPVVTYSTFVGVAGDSFSAVTADTSGNVYLAGRSSAGLTVEKLSSDGSTAIYHTALGSGFNFSVQAIAVDATGAVYLTGTSNPGLPTTAGAFQATAPNTQQHAFVAVVNAAGTALTYCSYLTGTSSDTASSIAVDSTGKVYITGYTASTNFPTSAGVFQTTTTSGQTGFVAKFDPTKSGAASLIYSTYLGGATTSTFEFGIAVDAAGNAYVTGTGGADYPTTAAAFHYTGEQSAAGGAYVTKLNPTATAPLVYSAYLGYQAANVTAIAVDGSGDAYVTGFAQVSDFPTTAGAYQTSFPGAYALELNSTGTAEVYSTFLVGPSEALSPVSAPTSIALLPGCVSACSAYIAGFTGALDFPAVNAIQNFNAGGNDIFAVEVSGNGSSALYSTYLGGSADESNQSILHTPGIAVTTSGDTVLAGFTGSTDFPVTLTTASLKANFAAKISSTSAALALTFPATLTFSAQPVPVPSITQAVTLRNLGSATMTISSIAASGDYTQSNTCVPSLAAGAHCTITVTFTPTQSGARTGAVTVTSNASNSPTTINLTGTGQDASYINLTSANLVFGNTPVGTAGPAQQVTLSNIGDQALTISSLTIGGTNPTDFFQSNNCPVSPATLSPNANCTISISFLPSQVGFRSGSVSVSSNSNFLANSTINMIGAGAGVGVSGLTLSTTKLTFGPQAVGTTSAQQTATLTNTGNVPVTISTVTDTTTNFILTGCAQSASTTINPGATCNVSVKFAPGSSGALTDTVTITDNTTANPHTFALSGTGDADSQTLAITPSSLVFPDQAVATASRTLAITITNSGTFATTFDRVVESGDFQITSTSCATLRPSATCTVNVLFKPTAAGSRTGSITLIDTATGSPQTVNLFGKGLTDTPTATISPDSLAFSTQPVGLLSTSQTVIVTNTGNITLNIASVTFSGANPGDFQQSNFCTTVTPARTCSISVTFTPTATGARTATMNVVDEAGTQSLSLSGTGTAAVFALSFAPGTLTFQNQAANTTSPALSVQVVNTGDEPITITNFVTAGPYTLGNNFCTSTLNPNTSCSISMTFTPTATGAQNGSLTLTDNASGSPHVINLVGAGVATAPTITLNPAGLAFGYMVDGLTSNQIAVQVTNTTAAAITGVGTAISGDFAFISNSCGTTIGASTSCSFAVAFTPTAAGVRTGAVTITDSAGTQTVNLAGYGAAAALSAFVRQTALTFPDQVIATVSGNQNVNLFNNGNSVLTISNVTISAGDFAISNGCSGTLNPNQGCNVGVTFTPTAAGNRTATVTITNNAPGSPRTIPVNGKGLTAAQSIVVDRPKLIFASQVNGTPSTQQTINVTNTGNAQVTISSVALSGTNSADFGVSNSCPLSPSTLAPGPTGNSCSISVTFTPSAGGARSATLTITDSDPASPHTVTLSGTGIAATKTLAVTPGTVTFVPQVVGTSSGFTQTVTVYNTGSAIVTFSSVTVSGNFSLSNNCVGTLAPGTLVTPSSCTIGLQFTPSTSGARQGLLTITDDATSSPQKIVLNGLGITASQEISLSQTSVVFDQEVINTASPQMTVYYYNQSNVTVNFTSVVLTGADFTMANGCVTSISPNSVCNIKITFKPTAAGIRTGTIVITDSAPASPRTINLSGTGVAAAAPAVTLTPSSLTFGNQTVGVASAVQNINVTNSGETSLGSISVSISGANVGDFPQTNNCPITLVAGFSCTIAVTFKPAALGARSASVSVSDTAAGSPQTVTLTGTGAQGNGPAVTLTPPGLTFSNVPANTSSAVQSSTLQNTGLAALTITGIAPTGGIPGDFSQTNNCPLSPSTLAVSASCTINVTFSPTSVIDQTAQISITDNAPNSPQALNLTGNGTAPAVNLSSTSLTFPARTVGTTSAAQTVTLENVGNLALTISSVATTGDFSVVSNTCSGSLGAGLTCTFGVTFKPTATGTRTGFVVITDNAGDGPQFMKLTGTGQ